MNGAEGAGEPTTTTPSAPVVGADAPSFDDEPPPRPFVITLRSWLRDYFVGEDPSLGWAIVPFCFVSMILFTRHPIKTNFIFDEQEALLANPFVRSVADPATKVRWIDAFHRDFWGLLPDRSIGSYRPIPDLVWRALWAIGARDQTPFLDHWVNVLFHGVNGALITVMVRRVTRDRAMAWMAGGIFVASAVLTEAVSGVVGIADVLGALGLLLALAALALPAWAMPVGVVLATSFGLFCKESALCAVPIVPFAALLLARDTHAPAGRRPLAWLRGSLALVATASAFVFYVEFRRRWFPAPLPAELTAAANADKPPLARAFAAVLRWYAQPALPRDALNNPLAEASPSFRVAGALRVYFRGLTQIVFPWTLSGDYSSPQEPIPNRLIFPESVLGALAMVGPLLLGPLLGIASALRARWREEEHLAPRGDWMALAGVALVGIVISYFPVSNIPIVLPTVRAERFWYFPAIGTSVLLAMGFAWLLERAQARGRGGLALLALGVFLGFQGVAARAHANDYTNDLVFWDATRRAVPRSAKAHLNYSVMQGARGNLQARLDANRTALELAPQWPMANVYLGDTLCRMHRSAEAWPHYQRGFELAPNDQNLVALGVQCLWDEHAMGPDSEPRRQLEALAERFPGSWVAFIARDTIDNGDSHNGVDPKYRPRGYNEGPKSD